MITSYYIQRKSQYKQNLQIAVLLQSLLLMSKVIKIGNLTIDPKDGYVFDTIATSSVADSAAETLDIKGLDLSSWDDGRGYVNWEHSLEEVDGKSKKVENPAKQVGAIVYSKKIYTKDDCSNEREALYWERAGEHPYVYAICQLFDTAGHPEAIRLAAILRAQTKYGPTHKIGTSIEGATISRDEKNPSILKETIGKALAVTIKPANKVCHVGTLADDNAPKEFQPSKEEKDLLADLVDKSENDDLINFGSEPSLDSIDNLAEGLNKAITAGNYNAAPGMLTGGAALQREYIDGVHKSVLKAALRDWGDRLFNKAEFKAFVKHKLPEVSDEFIDHFVDAIDDYNIKNKILKTETTPVYNLNDLKFKLDYIDIELRKAIDNIQNPQFTGYTLPLVYSMSVRVGNDFQPAGRYMVYNNKLTHLEDYHGLLNRLLPEGPLDEANMSRIQGLMRVPDIKIEGNPVNWNENNDGNGGETELDNEATEMSNSIPAKYPVVQPSVFLYHRLGMDQPITIECHNGEYLANGIKLTDEEVQIMLDNLNHEVATIRYKNDLSSELDDQVVKMEESIGGVFEDLIKNEMDVDDAMQALRAAVKSGHLPPEVERAMTKHVYTDTMGPIGNKYAFNKYMQKNANKPGVHVGFDGNNLKAINDTFGHEAGNHAIRAISQASREAMDETMGSEKAGKVFRTPENDTIFRSGGDEFNAVLPSHEHAAVFARKLHQKLEALPPINGAHKISVSMGIGHNPEMADKALYEAKKQKVDETGKPKFKIGQAPSFAHSLMPGHEGAIPLHNPAQAAVHSTITSIQNDSKPQGQQPSQPQAA